MKKHLKLIAALSIGVIAVLSLAFFALRNSEMLPEIVESVTVDQNGDQLVVSRDGSVVYKNAEGVFFDSWDANKTNAFFDYFDSKYTGDSQIVSGAQNSVTIIKNGNSYTYIVDDDEEIIAPSGEDAQTPDDNNGGGGPTPAPTSPPGGGGGIINPDPTCLYWTLSYCVVRVTPVPTATPQASTDPNANVIDAVDCGDYLSNNQAPTIINNTVCLPEPTQAP